MIVKPTERIHINIKGISILNGFDNVSKKNFYLAIAKPVYINRSQ